MDERTEATDWQLPGWIVTLAVAVYAAFELAARGTALAGQWPVLAPLLAGAAGAGWLTRGRVAPRLVLGFVLCAAALLPSPGALAVAAAALVAARGRALAGPPFRDAGAIAATLVAAAVVGYLGRAVEAARATDLAALVLLLLLFVVAQALAAGLALALRAGRSDAAPPSGWPRLLLLELVSVPAAWLLLGSLQRRDPATTAALIGLLLLATAALVRLERLLDELRRTRGTLSQRLAELATLHSIGREILSSLDPDRVLSVLDRECRKIFDVDDCFVALIDGETSQLRSAYRRRRGGRAELGGEALDRGVALWVVEEKRARRVDDLSRARADTQLHGPPIEPDSRSLIAVPLLVEERVIGVLGLSSRRAGVYDDHAVEVLTTIAQQAAVAIENARHYRMATVDSLTGFFTRDYFFRRLLDEDQRVRRYGGRFAVLMVDLDGFKEINDRNGHLAGDHYLTEIAATIRSQLRAADVACRYGGDEFCLLLPETDLPGAQVIGERVRGAVSRRIVGIEGLALRTTVSIGIAAFPEHRAEDLQALLQKADEALYRAKRAGRDRVVPFAA